MNPKFTEGTLNSFIFVIDIFCANDLRWLILHMKFVSVYYTKNLDGKNFWVFIMSWVTQWAEIYQNFLQTRNRLLQKRNVVVLSLNKRVYINVAQAFSFFFIVWSKSLKILAWVKIGMLLLLRMLFFYISNASLLAS